MASYQISILYYTKRMVLSRNSTLHPDSVQSRFGSRDKSRLLIFLWFETKFESVWEESVSLTVLCLWFVTLSLCFSVFKMSYSNSPSELHQDVFQYSYPHGYHYISGKKHRIYFFCCLIVILKMVVKVWNCI